MASVAKTKGFFSGLSWNTRISRTQLSTVDGLSLSAAPVLTAQSLEHVLRTVQQLGLYHCPFDELKHDAVIGEGESFRVERCTYNKQLVAVKHVRLEDLQSDSQSSYRRLQTVLLEIQIMRHTPLKGHPNILNALGYGWRSHGESLQPYIVVEYAAHGSLRAWLKSQSRGIDAKFRIAGDVVSGLKALHMCDIIHGDLKLDNIVVAPFESRSVQVIAKLCDFGHSIIVREGEKNLRYFGTALYNPPEVTHQEVCKLEHEGLQKCDIWAYGLSIWEIFADGARYFNKAWLSDPAYSSPTLDNPSARSQPPPIRPRPVSDIAIGQSESSYVMVSDNDESYVLVTDEANRPSFGNFDQKHLRRLSRQFIDSLRFPGLTIEKGYLRKLLDRTLQVDSSLRPSQITLIPRMFDKDRSDKGALQGQLAIHTGSAALTFQMFYVDQGSEIAWEYKRQILENLISISRHCNVRDEAAAALFQASICYIEGFGASPDSESALSLLQEAISLKHPMATLFGRSLRQALEAEIEGDTCYIEDVIHGFKKDRVEIRSLEVHNFSKVAPSKVVRFEDYDAFQSWLKSLGPPERQEMLCSYVIAMPYLIRMDMISLVTTMGDADFAKMLAGMFIQGNVTPSDTSLIQACRSGNTDIVHALLDAGADPEATTKNGCSFYHWLFMLGDGARSVAKRLLASGSKRPRSLLLDHPCTEHYVLHPQWPLKLTGTPLAFAILCGSTIAVEVLLDLGALPYAPIYGPSGDTCKIQWTPIHIAFKFHLASILRLLLAYMSETSLFTSPDEDVSISSFELACSISHSTITERLAMHGKGHTESLMETLALLPLQALHCVSSDGLTPFMEAIDFSNLDTVKAMLKVSPELAFRRFVDPEDKISFTYPAIFAAQIAARRDSSLAFTIVQLLLKQNTDYFTVKDSEGRTALHLSVIGYSTSLTKWLLENGYEVNSPDSAGRTAIHGARSAASLDILLGAGADINHTDRSGFTSVHLAALQGFEDVVENLIARNADLTVNKGFIGTPLHCAVLSQSLLITHMLLNAQDKQGNAEVYVNAVDGNGDTALHLAVCASRADIIQLLLSFGANPNIRNTKGFTPVHQCVLSGDSAMLSTFMSAEKLFRRASELRDSNLHCPCEESGKHISRLFKSWGGDACLRSLIDFDVSDERGRSPLHTAASYAGVEMARILLEHRANPHLRDADGNTTAHLAVAATDEHIAEKGGNRLEFLANALLNLTVKNRKGYRPWDISRSRNDFSLLHFILRKVGPRACNYETLLSCSTGRELLYEAIDRDEWGFVSLLFDPINRSQLTRQEIEARVFAQRARVKTNHKQIIDETDLERVFTRMLTATTLANSEEARNLEDQIALLQIQEYGEKQRDSLCRIISHALNYRNLREMREALDAPKTGGPSYPIFPSLNNSYVNELPEITQLEFLDPFRIECTRHDVRALESEALSQLETSLQQAPLGKPLETYTGLIEFFEGVDPQALVRLAGITSLLWTDRVIEEELDSPAEDPLSGKPVSDALRLRDGAALKQLFPKFRSGRCDI